MIKSIAISVCCFGIMMVCALSMAHADESVSPSYADTIQPILTKYCAGCHNADDREGDFSLATFAELEQGLEEGPAILAGQPDSSRMYRAIVGLSEPQMPPEDHPGPNAKEIAAIRAWIAAGARGPVGTEPAPPRLLVPTIASRVADRSPPITALAASPADDQLAIARFGHVEVRTFDNKSPIQEWHDFPGKVNALSFSRSGQQLVVAGGIAGLYGQADVLDVGTGEKLQSVVGHRDTLYDAEFSPDGTLLATASYDGRVILWNIATGEMLRTIGGHNGAVFDVQFDPSGTVLASASADETVKLWKVETGERLDTLSQPTAEQDCVAFSPDGKFVVAGGADNRIRVWKFLSRDESRINPLRYTRFAHDGAVVDLQFALDGQALITAGADRKLRLWDTKRYANSRLLSEQPAAIHDVSVNAAGDKLVVGLMDGTMAWHDINLPASSTPVMNRTESPLAATDEQQVEATIVATEEQEPNNDVTQPQSIGAPSRVRGAIHSAEASSAEDVDLYKFAATAGEKWVIEIKAARNKSPLDSKIAVLTSDGERITRLLLQAVRDSYFTFRGKSSIQSNDYRLHNWEEMKVNEYLYAGGEVNRLWHYPRGPDSGFNVYPGKGDRFAYFGTSSVSHALNEPAYIVEPHRTRATLTPTGLPVFPIYYENDDDGMRLLGADSHLEFTAPADGDYLIQVRDVRGFGGESYTYELTVRKPRPDFEVKLELDDGAVSPGGGKEFSIVLTRYDGFDREVRVEVAGLPEGFRVTSPVTIESNQVKAFGVVNALPDAISPPENNASNVSVTATADIGGRRVTKNVVWNKDLKLGESPNAYVQVFPAAAQQDQESPARSPSPESPLELTVAPGETISAVVRVTRKEGFNARVAFGEEEAGRNLPHGVYVDNIGLNGLLIVENTDEREFFITADTWVPETTRMFHLRMKEHGNQTSWPVMLHVRK